MKVGFVAPTSIAVVNGGVRTQATFTIRHLQALGVEPTFISSWGDVDVQQLDLVHVFGASAENTGIIEQLSGMGVPLVLSPVFYSNRSAGTIRKAIKVERWLSLLGSGIRSDFTLKAELCGKADLLLPNTSEESRLIENGFSISPQKLAVVPNGVEARFADAKPELFTEKYGLRDFVLFAGQAGARRKNVQALLKAAQTIDTPVVIIGRFNNDAYGKACQKLADSMPNVHLIDPLPHDSEMLASAFAACKVFVLPSQFETPGIAAMEAALAGAQIVITNRGGTTDYFGEFVEYIQPESEQSIAKGIQKALDKPRDESLKTHILQNFTWEKVAEKTLNQYRTLLSSVS